MTVYVCKWCGETSRNVPGLIIAPCLKNPNGNQHEVSDYTREVDEKEFNQLEINGNNIWEADLTNWLKNHKKMQNITKEDIQKWGEILNDNPSYEDIESFCSYTGWKKTRLTKQW